MHRSGAKSWARSWPFTTGQSLLRFCQKITPLSLRIHRSTSLPCNHLVLLLSIFPLLSRSSTSLTMIPLLDHEPEVEGKKTVTFAQDACKDALPSTSSSVLELCHPPSVNSTLLTTSGIDHDLFALDDVQSSVQVLLDHTLPLSKHRTNVVTEQYVPQRTTIWWLHHEGDKALPIPPTDLLRWLKQSI